jgi:hypothetical protein
VTHRGGYPHYLRIRARDYADNGRTGENVSPVTAFGLFLGSAL